MRTRAVTALLAILMLGGCAGYEKGNGLSRLDTITPEDKEEQKWFDKFYGGKPCESDWWGNKSCD